MPIRQIKKTPFSEEFKEELTDDKARKFKLRLRFSEDDNKYYYKNPTTGKEYAQLQLKIEDGAEVLHALGKNLDMSAANMLAVADARGWQAVEVFGSPEFQLAVFNRANDLIAQGKITDITFKDAALNQAWKQKLESARSWNKFAAADNSLAAVSTPEAQAHRAERAERLQARIDERKAEQQQDEQNQAEEFKYE